MNRTHMIRLSDAIRAAKARGMIAKVSRDGRRLHVYTGEESAPGTWMEIASTMIDESGCVSRYALRDVLQ